MIDNTRVGGTAAYACSSTCLLDDVADGFRDYGDPHLAANGRVATETGQR
ncbi:MAG TPA: hypothetical protein VL551_34380 [Actinospica sp.]|jgi:hypothetical protein|nr:hypothetical protein [Actinospica sp.]